MSKHVISTEIICIQTPHSAAHEGNQEASLVKNGPALEKPSIASQAKKHTQNGASAVDTKQLPAFVSGAETIKTKPAQLKWAEEVLNLLNTGTEKELSEKLTTIGPKTAAKIAKCRKIHGEYQHIEDLRKMLGWSENVYSKFLAKNFLLTILS